MNREKGQALPLAMLVLAIGTLVVTPFLGHAGSNLISSRTYEEAIMHQNSSDAGVEHAIWSLTRGNLAEQFEEPGDEVTYQLGETLNGVSTSITVTVNVTADGSVPGEIEDTVIDSLEFESFYGNTPELIHVSGDIYAVVYQGWWSRGFIKTVEINSEGEITNNVIDSLEFETSDCNYPAIVHVSGDIFAVAYQGWWSRGFIKTVEIDSDGDITGSVIDTLEFESFNGYEPDIIAISSEIYAIAYRGYSNDGYIRTVEIAPDGDITNYVIDSYRFENSDCNYPDIISVSGSIYAIVYRSWWSRGYVKTVEIASDGDITSVIDSYGFETGDCNYPVIIHVSGDVFAIAYQGWWSRGYIKTVEIASDGDITSVIDTLEFESFNGYEPDIIHVSDSIYAVVYRGSNNDGYIKTVEIAPDGDITNNVIDTLEYDTGDSYLPDIIHVSGGICAIAYQGWWYHGLIKTIEISITSGTSAAYEIESTAGNRTVRAFINTDNTTASILSWQYE